MFFSGDFPSLAQPFEPTTGTVVSWGSQVVPFVEPSTRYAAIAAGFAHTVGLKRDGTVVMWGDNYRGQMNVPKGLSGVTAVAAGDYHTVALKSNGSVVAWGGGNEGGETTVPADLSTVTAIAAGSGHTIALKSDGTVVAWGWNQESQRTVPAGLSGVIAIAAGSAETVALVAQPQQTNFFGNSYPTFAPNSSSRKHS